MSARDDADVHAGTAGASARREHARRRSNRERRVRERHPRIGAVLLAVGGEPAHERGWERGAAAEEHVARVLAKRVRPDVVVLHDRRIPGTHANLDHLAVTPSGIWVIDTKRYRGRVEVRRPLLGSPKLVIDGRDRTRLIGGLDAQVQCVRAAAGEVAPGVRVHGALCFVDSDLPLLRTLRIGGHQLLYPKALARRLNADGSLARPAIRLVAVALAQRLAVA
jgi:hypothetical protein